MDLEFRNGRVWRVVCILECAFPVLAADSEEGTVQRNQLVRLVVGPLQQVCIANLVID
jgi:hypothetical protein